MAAPLPPKEIVEDTLMAFEYVLSSLSCVVIRGVLISQLYAVLDDRSDVDESVQHMRSSGQFQVLSCANFGLDDMLIMHSEHYLEDFLLAARVAVDTLPTTQESGETPRLHMEDVFGNFSRLFIRDSGSGRGSVISVTRSELRAGGINDECLECLHHVGFLRPRRHSTSAPACDLSHPRLGHLVRAVQDGRACLKQVLRKRKSSSVGKEFGVSEELLMRTAVGGDTGGGTRATGKRKRGDIRSELEDALAGLSISLGLRYTVLEACGSGILQRVKSPTGGNLLKLAE